MSAVCNFVCFSRLEFATLYIRLLNVVWNTDGRVFGFQIVERQGPVTDQKLRPGSIRAVDIDPSGSRSVCQRTCGPTANAMHTAALLTRMIDHVSVSLR